MKAGLGYELTSQEYKGDLYCDIILDPINGAGLIPMTTVKKKGTVIVPLIIFNYMKEKFETTLGETSVDIPYSRFLTDALLAECNTSACFNLFENKGQGGKSPDSEYKLDITVSKCKTTSSLTLRSSTFLWVDVFNSEPDILTTLNNKVHPATSELEFNVTLNRNGETLHNKTYSLKHTHASIKRPVDEHDTNMTSIDNMAEGLSYATKEIVEEIAADLSMVINSQFN